MQIDEYLLNATSNASYQEAAEADLLQREAEAGAGLPVLQMNKVRPDSRIWRNILPGGGGGGGSPEHEPNKQKKQHPSRKESYGRGTQPRKKKEKKEKKKKRKKEEKRSALHRQSPDWTHPKDVPCNQVNEMENNVPQRVRGTRKKKERKGSPAQAVSGPQEGQLFYLTAHSEAYTHRKLCRSSSVTARESKKLQRREFHRHSLVEIPCTPALSQQCRNGSGLGPPNFEIAHLSQGAAYQLQCQGPGKSGLYRPRPALRRSKKKCCRLFKRPRSWKRKPR